LIAIAWPGAWIEHLNTRKKQWHKHKWTKFSLPSKIFSNTTFVWAYLDKFQATLHRKNLHQFF
jgi:hypothetical protein